MQPSVRSVLCFCASFPFSIHVILLHLTLHAFVSRVIFQVPLINIVDGSPAREVSELQKVDSAQAPCGELIHVQDIWQRIVDNHWIIGVTVHNMSVRYNTVLL